MAKRQGISPLEIFSQVPVTMDPAKWHPFECPEYVLYNAQQAAGKGKKWSERARFGMYIGQKQHARSLSLILNLQTGLVSPQYHVKLDPSFQSVRKQLGAYPTESLWQEKCGFKESSSDKTPGTPAAAESSTGQTTDHQQAPSQGKREPMIVLAPFMVRLPAKATTPTKMQQPLTKAPEEIPNVAPEGEPKDTLTNWFCTEPSQQMRVL